MEGHSLTSWGGGALCFGGKRGGRYTNDLWRVNIDSNRGTGRWELLHRGRGGPSPRAYHCAVRWRDNFLILLGGVGDNSEAEPSTHEDVMLVWDSSAGWRTQTAVGEAPQRRCHHTAVLSSQDTILVYGGYPVGNNAETVIKDPAFFDIYELSLGGHTPTWRRISSLNGPPMLWGHSAMIFAHNVIFYGGVDVVDSSESKTMCVWHSDRHEWRWIDFNTSPITRALHTAVGVGSDFYIFGGGTHQQSRKANDLWVFNSSSGNWSQISASADIPRRSGAASAHIISPQGKPLMFVHGGVDGNGETLSDGYLIDLSTGNSRKIDAVRVQEDPQYSLPFATVQHELTSPVSAVSYESVRKPVEPSSVEVPQQKVSARPIYAQLRVSLKPGYIAKVISKFMAIKDEDIIIVDCSSDTLPSNFKIVISGPSNSYELAEELLRRLSHPSDPLRSELDILSTGWWSELVQQAAEVPPQEGHRALQIDEIIPYSDDRMLVEERYEPKPVIVEQFKSEPAPAPEPVKNGASQGCQTAPVVENGAAGRNDDSNLIIEKQRNEIEALRQKVREVEDGRKSSSMGYLAIPDDDILMASSGGVAPRLSASTPNGPAVTLTKRTIADMLLGAPTAVHLPAIPPLSAAATAHLTRSSKSAAIERRAAEGIDESILNPSVLPTAHTDPTIAAPAHGNHPSYPHTGTAPRPIVGTVRPSRMRNTASVPSLKSIIDGRASMLSITHLGGTSGGGSGSGLASMPVGLG